MTHTTYITPAAPTFGVRTAFQEAAHRRANPQPRSATEEAAFMRRLAAVEEAGPAVLNARGQPTPMVVNAFCGGVDSQRMARIDIGHYKARMGRKVLKNV